MSRRPGAEAGPVRLMSQLRSFGPHGQRMVGVARALAKPCWVCAKYLLPLLLLLFIAGGIFYVRILFGPISLKMLASPIARSIAAELPGLGVSVEDALVRLNEEGELEFRLRNVRLLDADGSPIAVTPLAALSPSFRALRSGRVAPDEVVLIEPRLLLTYTAEHGLSFSFTRPGGSSDPAQSQVAAEAKAESSATSDRDGDPGAGLPTALRQLDLARVIAEASARARQGDDATSFLRKIGLRNATLIFEQGGEQRVWRVPQADFAFSHKKTRSLMAGLVTVDSGRGPWTFEFSSEASEATRQVMLRAAVRDVVPSTVADALPPLAPLRALSLPASGDVTLQLTSQGELIGGSFSLDLARGEIVLPWFGDLPLMMEGGNLDLKYDPNERALLIEPSTIAWGRSRVTIAGKVSSSIEPDGGEVWTYALASVEGRLAPEDGKSLPIEIESWRAEGTYRPASGAFTTEQTLKAGGGELHLSGEADPRVSGVRVEGRAGTVPIATIMSLWPRALGSNARTLLRESISGGQILAGSLRFVKGPDKAGRNGAERLSIAFQTTDIVVNHRGLPKLEVPNALIRLEGPTLEVTVPKAAVTLASGRKIDLSAGRFTAVDILSEYPIAQIAFRSESSAPAVIELIEHEAFGIGRLAAIENAGIDGKFEADLTITVPLHRSITLASLKVEGQGKLTEGSARKLIGKHDAQAATIAFDINEKAITASGDLLIAGVPVKLAWQHIFGALPERQPPLRLSATLDRVDRDQLGLDPRHMLDGEVPVEVTITQSAEEEHLIHVWADLTRADVVLDSVIWRKRPGRAAIMEFDLRPGTRYPLELRDFKIVGDDIAISGWVGLDEEERLNEFHFPEFSASIITRLDVKGVLGENNIWRIKAEGPTYDGREVFRSLFSVGDLDEPDRGRKKPAGVDLEANISTVIGFSDVALRNFKLRLSEREGKLTALTGNGVLDGGKPLTLELQHGPDRSRRLVALTDDAGQAFRLVDFYPSLVGGRMRLDVNLDGQGAAEKTGLLRVERFRILGDPIVTEVLQVQNDGRSTGSQRERRVIRQAFDFDWMRMPFSIGHGQFVIGESEIRGPLVGATLRGKADFRSRQVNIGGTYVPLQGLNAALGAIPGLGQIIAGPRGEGILGITFAIRGPMANPEVLVNPLSLVAPGIFREMFQMTPSQSVTPPRAAPQPSTGPRSSRTPAGSKAQRAENVPNVPEVLSGWSSETRSNPPTKTK